MISTQHRKTAKLNSQGDRKIFQQVTSLKINVDTQHQIYSNLLSLLQNKRIRCNKSGGNFHALPDITRQQLSLQGISNSQIRKIEESIYKDVENMRDYDIVVDAPLYLYYELKKLDSVNTLFNDCIVAIPGRILNPLVCEKLLEKFSVTQLLTVPGFILIHSFDEAGNRIEAVHLDIDSYHCRRGFMVPVIKSNLIVAIKIFRFPNDEKPFLLRSRNSNSGGLK